MSLLTLEVFFFLLVLFHFCFVVLIESHCVTQADLELVIFCPSFLSAWITSECCISSLVVLF